MEPRFELTALRTNDRPGYGDRVGDAGRLQGDLLELPITSTVRSIAAESGNWTLAIRRPLSWLGMNPAGTRAKPKPVRPSRPT